MMKPAVFATRRVRHPTFAIRLLASATGLFIAVALAPNLVAAGDAEELWASQGTVVPFSDPLPAPSGFVEVRDSAGPPSEELTSAAGDRPFLIFAPHPLSPVPRDYSPRPWERVTSIENFAALDDYEPFTFAVFTLKAVRSLRAEVGPLTLRGQSHQIPNNAVDLRAVRSLNRYMGEKKFRREPIVLEKDGPCHLPAHATRQYWLTVYVSGESRPGIYEGEVRLTCEGAAAQILKLRLHVLPIHLLRPPTVYGFWYDLSPDWKGFFAESPDACRKMMKRHFVQMREYGLNSLGIFVRPVLSVQDGKVSCDFLRDGAVQGSRPYGLADLMRLGAETRLLSAAFPVLHCGMVDMGDSTLAAQAASLILREAKAQGWPSFVFVPVHEVDRSEKLRSQAALWLKGLKSAGATTGATFNGLWFGQDSADSDALRGLVDVRIFNGLNANVVDAARRAEKRLWLYNAGCSPWEPKRNRFVLGLYAARCRAEGCFLWAYQWPARAGLDPYHELGAEAQFYGQSFAYPAPDGPLPTIALEAVREGIDDMRYIYTLAQLIAEARNAGRNAEADNAANVFSACLSDIPVNTSDMFTYVDRLPEDQMHTARWQIASTIMSLQTKTRGEQK